MNAVFDFRRRSDISNFRVNVGSEFLGLVEVEPFGDGQSRGVSKVPQSFHLAEMHQEVHVPEGRVVGVDEFKLSHLFRSSSDEGSGGVDVVFVFHELLVLSLDSSNNFFSVDAVFVVFPVDALKSLVGALLVEVVENGRKLTLSVNGRVSA